MGKPTKQSVIDALKELGVEVDASRTLKELEAELETLKTQGAPEKGDVPARITQDPPEENPERLKSSDSPVEPTKEYDYLQKYQYRKQTPFGSVASNPQPGSKAATMKKALLGQERRTIVIPLRDGDDPNFPHTVNLNGYRLDFPRNIYVEVPLQIAELIMDALKQTNAALAYKQIDKKNEGILI